jgi:hypothetical protein
MSSPCQFFFFLHALPHFCICSRISFFLVNTEFNVLAGNKYGWLETEGHVGSVDNITQINTGRLYTYIQSATRGVGVQHESHINSSRQFFFSNEPCKKIHVANAVSGTWFTSDKGRKMIGRGNDGCRNK